MGVSGALGVLRVLSPQWPRAQGPARSPLTEGIWGTWLYGEVPKTPINLLRVCVGTDPSVPGPFGFCGL